MERHVLPGCWLARPAGRPQPCVCEDLCLFGCNVSQIVLVDDERGVQADCVRHPVDLQLDWVLGKMPQKDFKMERRAVTHQSLRLPAGLTVKDALWRVLRLPAVASKRYLTNKVLLRRGGACFLPIR